MNTDILKLVERFQQETGLSDHRIGILVANNGRLLDRLKSGGRIWPETEEAIRVAIKKELQKRKKRKAI